MIIKKKRIKLITSFFIVISFITIVSLVNINMINTKSLSPIGNTYDNFKLVSSEFGEDFTGFIQDNSNIKIYEDNGEFIVSLNNKKIKIKEESKIINGIKSIILSIGNGFSKIFSTIEEFTTKIL
ncbi:MAG: hypothetical protein KIB43_05695 [Clostridium baratii]|uniref:Uncharacterized protein n=1 Tax=Clostridium baratii str. Sullivan TaxID=1415775 RepID=A0A0A7FTY0_9CLOT|nr:hypothetical protein [Clostridium baratii]AIY82370.1 hypothetical protein U729_53 [Clostridium baratii str. Sullivan]MBS6006435.1 hypothetical protein [Clostridium baratii]MDU1053895.1 hypothetical protein [Clostridium baratii]MDU4910798.1 hypothetical protein [Clostridium baratii]CUO90000.1 Uncharacterised protein [Clostridium baratii]